MNKFTYLSQSYSDAWDDYIRCMRNTSLPTWDYIILTASNEHQAEAFRGQIEARKGYLPARTQIGIIPDEGGARIGSGGATLSVLRWLRMREKSFSGLRVLVIHSGGDSRRVPQYSALGKLFSPVPHMLPDGRSSTLFDEFMISMASVPSRFKEGMLLLSGDVLLLFNPLLIDWNGSGAAVISFKEPVETGRNHGVFLRGEDGFVRSFLHKQSIERLREAGAVNAAGDVDIDTGILVFGVDVQNALYSLICTEGVLDEDKYRRYVNDTVCLSLYGDFQYPMAIDSTLEDFYGEKAEKAQNQALRAARTEIWNTLHPHRLKLLRLAPAKFLHFGTTREILALVNSDEYSILGWTRSVNSSGPDVASYDSVIEAEAEIATGAYIEVSYVRGRAKIGEGSVISYVDVEDMAVPPHVVLHGLKQANGRFVCRIYGTADNPKEGRLFGHEMRGDLWNEGDPHTLWHANIYPECSTIREALQAALKLYDHVMEGRWEDIAARGNLKSLESGFNDADSEAILAWNRRMYDLVRVNKIGQMIHDGVPVRKAQLIPPLSPIQQQWRREYMASASWSERMRLEYYLGTALGDEGELTAAFSELSAAILKDSTSSLKANMDARIVRDEVDIALPLRVNFGGGWSDTPPYCNEQGGTVLNAAITLSGEKPIRIKLRRIKERKIVFDSRDMDSHGEFSDIDDLLLVGDPYDPFILQKATMIACGVYSMEDRDLNAVLDRLGSGFIMNTEVIGVPRGSGLGTSSILAAACVKGIYEFMGIPYDEAKLYSTVLCVEQLMSTGGGWQDQVGGVTDGIKYITSRPGLKQTLKVQHLQLAESTMRELNERFCLIYTGQRRLARHLLRDVVGRYIGNEPDVVYALNEIQRNATLQRFELERGNVDAFADLLTQHWELSKILDAGSTNTLIDQIFGAIDDYLAGKMICGAGGGGFLQVVMKKGVTREQLQRRLREVFSDTDISVWECEIV